MNEIHIGASGWSYKDWLGNFYPAKAKPTEYLAYYATRFNAVEIDSTFYGIPRKSTVEGWYKAVPANFRFSPKFPQEITHESDLTGVDATVSRFLDTMTLLKEKLGPLLIQFAYSFKPEMFGNLQRFLESLPGGFNYVVEIRNRKWLDERFYDLLRKNSVGLALLERPWMPKPAVATSDTLYIRFMGDRHKMRENFSHEQIDRVKNLERWVRLIRALEKKIDDFYGYFNNHYSGHSPTIAARLIKMLDGIKKAPQKPTQGNYYN